jgi:hypothetical protein
MKTKIDKIDEKTRSVVVNASVEELERVLNE